MKLKELLNTNSIKSFNLDIIGMKCDWSNLEHTSIIYSGDIAHDYGNLTKDTIDPKYLEYSIVDIYGFDDGLSITIDEDSKNSDDFESIIKEKDHKIAKLLQVCYIYSEEFYNFFSHFTKDNLTEEQFTSLIGLKKIIDDHISADKSYKNYLDHRYLKKDYIPPVKNLEELVASGDANFQLDKKYVDDTETLIIKEYK